jgi:hypothetical protein
MADNHNPRSADKDVAFLGDDDPLAELMRIAGLEPQSGQAAREPVGHEPDEFDFDLEAELLRSFDVSETPATFVENADEPSAEEAPAGLSAEPADVEELPAFLQRRPPANEVIPEESLSPEPEAAILDDATAPAAEDAIVPEARAPRSLDEEWVDLPEWTRPTGRSRTDAIERVEIEAEPEVASVDEPIAQDFAVADTVDAAPIDSETEGVEQTGDCRRL